MTDLKRPISLNPEQREPKPPQEPAHPSKVETPPLKITRREYTKEEITNSIPYEITKLKDPTQDAKKRIVIKKGRIPKSARWIYWQKMKAMYWNNLSELDEIDTVKSSGFLNKKQSVRKTDRKLIFDLDFCEPLDENMKPQRSQVVEKALINQSMDDFAEVVALTGFEITSKQIAVMIVVALLFLPFGLSLNSFFHIFGNTSIHWLPSIPR